MEDDLWWKTTFGGEATSKQGRRLRFVMLIVLTNIRSTKVLWKTTFGKRQPSVEEKLWWILAYCLIRLCMLTGLTNIRSTKVLSLMEDNLWRKTTFSGRRPLVEDALWWKTTFGRRRPSVEDNLWWKTTFGKKRCDQKG